MAKKAVNRPTCYSGCYNSWPSLAPPYDPVLAPVAPGAREVYKQQSALHIYSSINFHSVDSHGIQGREYQT